MIIDSTSSIYLLSVDLGTEGCRAMIFDEKGNSLARSYQQYQIIVPKPSWAEQDPNVWWEAFRNVVSGVSKSLGNNSKKIACISLTGQSPVVLPVDKSGNPLMNALIWMDRRAVKQSMDMEEDTGLKEDPSMVLPKIAWIKEHRPRTFRKTEKFLQATDFLAYKLTGKFATDWLNASNYHFDIERSRYPDEILDQLKIPYDKFPEVYKPTEIVGTITERAFRDVGIKKGTPVVIGGIDAYMAMIGVNALKEGSVCEITGSSTCLMVPSNNKIFDKKKRILCVKFPLLPNFWVLCAIMSSTGASIRWFLDEFGQIGESYSDFDREAERAPVGSDGMIFLPYMMGERSPLWDSAARGVFIGLSLNHTKRHMIRSILEGCAFGIRQNMEIIEELGGKINEIRSCGGAAKSPFFGKIKADITRKPIIIPREIEASALGAAIIGSVAIGVYNKIETAARNIVKIKNIINPQGTFRKEYEKGFQMYKDAYAYLRNYFKKYYLLNDFKIVREKRLKDLKKGVYD